MNSKRKNRHNTDDLEGHEYNEKRNRAHLQQQQQQQRRRREQWSSSSTVRLVLVAVILAVNVIFIEGASAARNTSQTTATSTTTKTPSNRQRRNPRKSIFDRFFFWSSSLKQRQHQKFQPRKNSNDDLSLFWSRFEMSIDAATISFGPLYSALLLQQQQQHNHHYQPQVLLVVETQQRQEPQQQQQQINDNQSSFTSSTTSSHSHSTMNDDYDDEEQGKDQDYLRDRRYGISFFNESKRLDNKYNNYSLLQVSFHHQQQQQQQENSNKRNYTTATTTKPEQNSTTSTATDTTPIQTETHAFADAEKCASKNPDDKNSNDTAKNSTSSSSSTNHTTDKKLDNITARGSNKLFFPNNDNVINRNNNTSLSYCNLLNQTLTNTLYDKKGETTTISDNDSKKNNGTTKDSSNSSTHDEDIDETNTTTNTTNSIEYSNKDQLLFRLYQTGDGSETDPDGIPTRYLRMHNHPVNHRLLAQQALHTTLDWRRQNNIDTLLNRPHRKFDLCKQVFPTAFLGRYFDPKQDDSTAHDTAAANAKAKAKNKMSSHVIFLQRPALIDVDLAHRNHLNKDELLMHYVYMNEYLWQVLEASSSSDENSHNKYPMGTVTTVLDLTGLTYQYMLSNRDYFAFLKAFALVTGSHYPQRAHKTIVVNAPNWFHLIYKITSPLLSESTKERVEIYAAGTEQEQMLERYFGGSGDTNDDSIDDDDSDVDTSSDMEKKKRKQRAQKMFPASFWSSSSSSNKKGTTGKSDNDNDKKNGRYPMTDMERDFRDFVVARLEEAGETMLPFE